MKYFQEEKVNSFNLVILLLDLKLFLMVKVMIILKLLSICKVLLKKPLMKEEDSLLKLLKANDL